MSSTLRFLTSATATASATATCISVTPDKNGYVPEWACNANYEYYPSIAAALVFAVIFGLSLVLHICQAFAFSKKKLCWVLIMGVAWEFGSFSVRAASTRHQQIVALQFVSQLLVLLAPMVSPTPSFAKSSRPLICRLRSK